MPCECSSKRAFRWRAEATRETWMSRTDPHSYADDSQTLVTRLSWKARVDFASRRLNAETVLSLGSSRAEPLDLDTKDLSIESVKTTDGEAMPFIVHAPEPILKSRLRLDLP